MAFLLKISSGATSGEDGYTRVHALLFPASQQRCAIDRTCTSKGAARIIGAKHALSTQGIRTIPAGR
jgi:hypothetical protein